MCARCMLMWEVEELKDKLEKIGKELGCWFYVDLDDNLMVFWRAFKDVDDDSIELLGNGDSGCTFNEFEEDVANMPAMITKVLQEKQFA